MLDGYSEADDERRSFTEGCVCEVSVDQRVLVCVAVFVAQLLKIEGAVVVVVIGSDGAVWFGGISVD